jgi:predicted CXXCH cytochrome family protein
MRTTKSILLALLAAWGAWAGAARAAIPAEQDDCLGCHGSDPSQTMDLPGGDKLPLFVDAGVFARSVHGEILRCGDCHSDKSGYPHDSRPFQNRRDVTVAYYEQCKSCHFANYTKTLDGVHFAVMAKGNRQAALCVDCHGAHDISRPTEPRSRISRTCAACHAAVNQVYLGSVHGKGLTAGNQDVPVCTDCHRAHDIADPRDGSLALRTPEVCGRCHTDPKMMRRYGLSTRVVDTYLRDFHGMSSSLSRPRDGKAGRTRAQGQIAAVCTDCHGVHEIQKARDPGSPVVRANLVKTCRKCHADATEAFPASWLSHYDPSPEKAPLVWLVQAFYRLMIPFMIGGLVLQIALHLWRVVVNR